MTLTIFGQVIEPVPQGPPTLWESIRWPFGGRVVQIADGSYFANITSSSFMIWSKSYATDTDPNTIAVELDAVSKSIFSQAAWYQQP